MYKLLCLVLTSLLTITLSAAAKLPSLKIQRDVSKAIRSGDLAAFKTLLTEHELAIDSPFAVGGVSLLHKAVLAGEFEFAEHLIDLGADVNITDDYGLTPLDEAFNFDDTKMIELLEQNGATRGQASPLKAVPTANTIRAAPTTDTDIISAVKNDDTETIVRLLDDGANIETTNVYGDTLLIIAAYYGHTEHTETVELLLDRGANIEATDNKGGTALILAAQNGRTKTVKLLLDRDANIEATNDAGDNALILAACNGQTETVKLLLDRNANIEATDDKGYTALMIAAKYGYTETVELLLERDANIEATNDKGYTALMIAERSGSTETIEMLRKWSSRF